MPEFQSVVELLEHRATAQVDDVAYVLLGERDDADVPLTFGALDNSARTLAGAVAARAAPGERVLLVFPTSLEFIVAFFACMIAGVIPVPIMPPRRNARCDASAAIIANCTPRLAMVHRSLAEDARVDLHATLGAQGLEMLLVDLSDLPPSNPVEPGSRATRDDLAFLQYTSGSTSLPKGVMVSHGNLLANLEMIRCGFGNHRGSTHICWLPFYHDMGLIQNLLQTLYLGACCVVMPPVRFMHRPLSWLRAIHRYRGEVTTAPNFAYELCVERFNDRHLDGLDLSCWKLAINGAEPVRRATLERFAACYAPYGFAASALSPGYGLAEATLLVSCGPRGRGVVTRCVSLRALHDGRAEAPENAPDAREIVGCGRAVAGIDLAIVESESRRRLSPGQVGEIWLHGPNIARGYWGNDPVRNEAFAATIADEGAAPWLRTGDLAFADEQGEVFITGRLKDLIIIRGVNHYPQDIEQSSAESHPALRREFTAAFSVSDEVWGERLVIVQEVGRSRQDNVTVAGLSAAIRAAVVNAHEVTPHEICLVRANSVPKTSSGKIQRGLSRRMWCNGEFTAWTEAAPADDVKTECYPPAQRN